ncbi:hypothetical protein GCM10010449_50090 [Streptomyces rectiviolaceus]|uniref:Uncharacterized protein n=1 Tax=Streptomyces rectiviolaceus TaxID=332591 RepID=A0ABP6MR97_9ACTN
MKVPSPQVSAETKPIRRAATATGQAAVSPYDTTSSTSAPPLQGARWPYFGNPLLVLKRLPG